MIRSKILRSAASVLIIAGLLAVVPAASAGQPQALNFNPDELNTLGTDVGVDGKGKFAGAVIRTAATDTLPAGTERNNLHVYRLPGQTVHSRYSQDNVSTESFDQKLAVPSADNKGAEDFAVAGPDGKIFLFDRTISDAENPRIRKQWDDRRANDIDIGPEGDYVAVAFNDLDQAESGTVMVLVDQTNKFGQNAVDIDSEPTSIAITPGVGGGNSDAKVVVGTIRNGVKFYFDTAIDDNTKTFTRDMNTVTDVGLSDRGRYAAVGTAAEAGGRAGGVYFFGQSSSGGSLQDSYDQFVDRFNNPRTSVTETAITADGKWFAAGAQNGEIRLYKNTAPDDPTTHSAQIEGHWQHPDGSAVEDLDVSDDGRYYVASVGDSVFGFTRDSGEVLWRISDVQGSMDHVDVSDDGERFVGVSNQGGEGYVYGWTHQRDIDVSPQPAKPTTEPRETVTVAINATNEGSNIDTFTFLASPPSNWGASPTKVTREILPGRSTNFTINLTPPKREAPGIYPTTIRTSSQASGSVVEKSFVNTTVPRVDRINITTPNRSISVDAGTERIVPFEVDNKGNQQAFVNVSDIRQSHSTGEAWEAEVREWERTEPVRIPRGGSTTLTLALRPPGTAADGDYSRMTVILDAGGDTDTFNLTARVNPQFDFSAQLTQNSLEIAPDEFREVELILRNEGNSLDIIRINTTVTPEDVENHWNATVPPGKGNVTLGRGETKSVLVRIEPDADDPDPATIRFELDSRGQVERRLSLEVKQPPDEDDDGIFGIPGPGPAAAVAAAALATAARRARRNEGSGG